MNESMEIWEKEKGRKFLRKIGIGPGNIVLDFGARVGHYTFPLAQIVGDKGLVYALDKDRASLIDLRKKARERELENIILIETSGDLEIDLEDNFFDAVLAYDVLHLINNRQIFYIQIHRVLKKYGLFSVYPKHNMLDSPGYGFENMTPEDIKKEIENYGFAFKKEHCNRISHDNELNYGCVLNFINKK